MKFLITLYTVFCLTFTLIASEKVGIHVDEQGLVTKIIPFYKDPVLEDDTLKMSKEQGSHFTLVDEALKKSPSALDNELKRLESLPSMNIPIKSAPLHAAIRLCAEAANMNYVAPPSEAFLDTVTLKVKANPYEILSMLSDHHGLGMEFKRGMWHFYRINNNELITRKYKLKYNNHEIIHKNPPSLNKTIDASFKSSSPYGKASHNGVFSIDTESIVRDIQKMLSLPTTGLTAVVENGGSVGA
ncbi:hypothetical protein KC872_05175, partial [Candidatus Kaiserbacteria bacterium]|nr:hypothetical protein [Candidatus Kaiserbacteria bacterium]